MRTGPAFPLLLALLLLPAAAPAQTEGGFLLVVHAENPTRTLDRATLGNLFLRRDPKWPNGPVVEPVDLPETSPVRDAFSQVVFGRSASSILSYWQRELFSGRSFPPEVVDDDFRVLRFVRANPGAIGYVSPFVRLPPGVRRVALGESSDFGDVKTPWGESAEEGAEESPEAEESVAAALALALDPSDPAVLYATFTGQGLHKSRDGGETWFPAGDGPALGTVSAVAVDPSNPRTVYVGGEEGLARSFNAGGFFEKIPGTPRSIALVAVDPRDSSVLYVARRQGSLWRSDDRAASFVDLGEALAGTLGAERPPPIAALALSGVGQGLYAAAGRFVVTSRDRGASWFPLAKLEEEVRDLALEPARPVRLHAATASGVWTSLAGGFRWQRGGLTENVFRLAAAPPALFAAAEKGIFRSFDGGETWEQVTDRRADVIAVDPRDPGRIYAASFGQVLRSRDQGTSWRTFRVPLAVSEPEVFAGKEEPPPAPIPLHLNPGGDGDHVAAIVLDPSDPDVAYVASRRGVWKSVDAGHHWAFAGAGLELTDVHVLAVDPKVTSILYAGTHGAGVWKSTDGGRTWWAAREGLTDLVIDSLAVDPHVESRVYAGTREGLFASPDGGRTWKKLEPLSTARAGNPAALSPVEEAVVPAVRHLAFEPRRGLEVLAATDWGRLYRGDATAGTAAPVPGRIAVDLDRVRAGCSVSRGVSGPSCYAEYGIDPQALALRDLAFPSRGSARVVATVYGLWRQSGRPFGDGADSWTRLDLEANVAAVAASPGREEPLYAAATSGLWESRNGGDSWTMTEIRSPLYSVAVDPRGDPLYAGVDGGLLIHREVGSRGSPETIFVQLPPNLAPVEKLPDAARRVRPPAEVTPRARRLWNRLRVTPADRLRLQALVATELLGRTPPGFVNAVRRLLIAALRKIYDRHEDVREIAVTGDGRWLQTSYLLDGRGHVHSELRLYDLTAVRFFSGDLPPGLVRWSALHDLDQEPEHLRPAWVLPDPGPVLAWSGDGRYVATHAALGQVKVWAVATQVSAERQPPPRVPAANYFELELPGLGPAAVAADGRSFAVAGRRGDSAVVELARLRKAEIRLDTLLLEGTKSDPVRVSHLVFLPGRQLLVFDTRGAIRAWTGDDDPVGIHRTNLGAAATFRDIRLSSDLRWLVVSTSWELLVWRLDGSRLREPLIVAFEPRGVLFSGDNGWLLVHDSGRLRVFDLRQGRLGPSVIEVVDQGLPSFSPGGERFFVRDGDKATVWDLTMEPIRSRVERLEGSSSSWRRKPLGDWRTWSVRGVAAGVQGGARSRDRRWFAKAEGVDVDLWDVAGATPRVLRARAGRFGPVGIHPDEPRWLPSLPGLPEGGLERLNGSELRDFACRVVGRSLTVAEWKAYLGDEPYQPVCVVRKESAAAVR